MSNEIENGIRYESKTIAPCESRMEFTASASAVGAAFKTAVREAVKYARIPGFRPGKAPASMVKTRYKDYIAEDVERSLQSAGFENSIMLECRPEVLLERLLLLPERMLW